MNDATTPTQDLGRALAALRRHWRPAAAILVLTLLATGLASRLGKPHYQATAQILLQQPDQVNAVLNPDGVSSPANAQRDVTTNAQLITSIPVADAVRRQLHLRETSKQLIARLSVTGETTSNLVEITARDATADRASQVATAVATQYQTYRRQSAQDAIQVAINAANARLHGMDAAGQASAAGQALENRLHQLQTGEAVATGGVQLVRPAAVPAGAAPRISPLVAAVALIFGLALAALAVAVLERTDRRLLDEAAIRDAFRLPVIGRLPPSGGGRRQRARAEALDALAARLRFVTPKEKAQVIMVAAAAPYAGDQVAIQLGHALAGFESCVMVIDANLRRPAPRGGDGAEEGLAAVLCGRRALEDELVSLTGEEGDDAPAGGDLQLLPAGRARTRPMALLAGGEMSQLLAAARERADVVVVAAPALVHGGESLALASLCDEIVVVARPGATTRDHAAAGREVLAAARARVAGLVLDRTGGRRRRRRTADELPALAAERRAAAREPVHPSSAAV
jgi:capsular polysaccharide biosynthesis protein/Mrp family chromosome partitioning ATPase